MTTILCLDCRRPTVSHPSGRCVVDRAVRQASIDGQPARRARKARLYTPEHRAERAVLAPIVAAGIVVCRRCGQKIMPGDEWDLGHGGPISQPEHAACNRGDRHE